MEHKIQIREMQKAELPQASEAVGKAFATTPATLAIYDGNSTAALRFQHLIKAEFKSPTGRCFVNRARIWIEVQVLYRPLQNKEAAHGYGNKGQIYRTLEEVFR